MEDMAMAELMLEALEVAGGWAKGIKNKTLIKIATAFAMLALDSKEEDVPGVLRCLLRTMKKFESNEAKILAERIRLELKTNWIETSSRYEHVALMM